MVILVMQNPTKLSPQNTQTFAAEKMFFKLKSGTPRWDPITFQQIKIAEVFPKTKECPLKKMLKTIYNFC